MLLNSNFEKPNSKNGKEEEGVDTKKDDTVEKDSFGLTKEQLDELYKNDENTPYWHY